MRSFCQRGQALVTIRMKSVLAVLETFVSKRRGCHPGGWLGPFFRCIQRLFIEYRVPFTCPGPQGPWGAMHQGPRPLGSRHRVPAQGSAPPSGKPPVRCPRPPRVPHVALLSGLPLPSPPGAELLPAGPEAPWTEQAFCAPGRTRPGGLLPAPADLVGSVGSEPLLPSPSSSAPTWEPRARGPCVRTSPDESWERVSGTLVIDDNPMKFFLGPSSWGWEGPECGSRSGAGVLTVSRVTA